MITSTRTAAAAALALTLVGLGAGSAAASDRPEVRTEGTCSGGSEWKLKAKTDSPGIEVEFEVDSGVAGQTWNVKVTDQGAVVFNGQQTTTGRSGSFSLERNVPNRPGNDRFVAKATNPATGETCKGIAVLKA